MPKEINAIAVTDDVLWRAKKKETWNVLFFFFLLQHFRANNQNQPRGAGLQGMDN